MNCDEQNTAKFIADQAGTERGAAEESGGTDRDGGVGTGKGGVAAMSERMTDHYFVSDINRATLSMPSEALAAQGTITQNPECKQVQIIFMSNHLFCKYPGNFVRQFRIG